MADTGMNAPDLASRLMDNETPELAKAVDKKTKQPAGPLTLAQLKRMFDEARDKLQDAREDSELSRDYYDGKQFTPAALRIYKKRKQPAVVINRTKRAIDGIMGVVEGGNTDPRALMRNPPDDLAQPGSQPNQPAPPMGPQPGQMGQPQPGQQVMGGNGGPPMVQPAPPPQLDAGDVATMALRFMDDTTHFKATKMDVLENGLIEGCGAAIFEIDGQDVSATQIRWEEFFYDPYSRRHDFKDAKYMGIAKWMYASDLSAMYPQVKDAMVAWESSGVLPGASDSTWDDRPNTGTQLGWSDTEKKRCMVVDMYHQHQGTWYRCVFYAGDILEYGPSAYHDDKGQPDNPIEAWAAYVDRQNNRYGIVKDMRPIQDEINMRRSKALHEINSRQVQQKDANVPPVKADIVRDEAARPDGVIPPGWQVVPRNDVVANNVEMLNEAKSEMDRMAPSPALLGRHSADASGRAQQVSQQAGLTELSRVLGRHHAWTQRAYTQMYNRARQFWTAPKWIRVTNDNDAPQYLQINEPTPTITAQHPETGQMLSIPGKPKNHIAEMDVDIVLEDVPDTATLEQEIFNELSQLAATYGPQNVPFEIILEMSQLPKKRELINKLKAFQAQQAPAQQQAAQLAAGKTTSEINKNNSGAAKSAADLKLTLAQAGLAEVETVNAAFAGHLDVATAAALPPGVTLDKSGTPVPLAPPPPTPPPGATGDVGQTGP